MGVKLGRWHWGRNVGWGCLRIGCWGEYLGLRGTKWQGNGEKLHNEELSNLYSLPNIVRMAKSRRMRWAGHVARMGQGRGVYRVMVGKSERKRPLGRPRRRWEDNVKKWEGVLGTGWSWLRIGTGCGHLWVRWWTYGYHKMRGISWLAAEPVSFSRRTVLHGVSK